MDGQSSAAPAARSSMDASKNHTRNSHPHASASSSSTTSAASLAALLDEDEDTKAAAASPTRAAAAVGERMDSAATSPVDIHPKLAQRTVSATKTTDHPLAAAAPSSSKRDSFRHSFVLVPDEHPLMPKAQHATKSHPSALSIAESSGAGSGPLDEDEEQEAIIRRNQAAAAPSPDSLSGIIRAAIEEATDPAVLQAKQRMAAIQAADATFAAEAAAAAAAAAAASVPASSPSAVPSDPLPAPLPSPPAHAPRAAPNTTAISLGRLMKLLNFFMFSYSKNPGTYRSSPKSLVIQQRVTALCAMDYHISVIHNDSKNGAASNLAATHAAAAHNGVAAAANTVAAADSSFEYCSSYPLELIIFENERLGPFGIDHLSASGGALGNGGGKHTLHSRINDSAVLKPLFRLSRFSRVHGRFVCPVILVRDKNICRSSTLAIQAEAIFNNIHAKTKDIFGSVWGALSGGFGLSSSGSSAAAANGSSGVAQPSPSSSSHSVQVGLEGQRGHDIQLLQHLATAYVEDLMVEHRKKKLGVPLTSSEKNEEWRYAQMKLNALPYPGCEFFTEYRSNNHSGLGLLFNWNQSFISSDLVLSTPMPFVPDEMLSTNGVLPSIIQGPQGQKVQRRGNDEAWFEFQHSAEDHAAERDARLKADAAAADAAAAAGASSTSPPPLSPPQSTTPDVSSPLAPVEHLVEHLIDNALTHSHSALSSEPMATTIEGGDSTAVGIGGAAAAALPPLSPPVAAPAPVVSAMPAPITGWRQYREWDVVTLTKNYLLICLAHAADESPSSGLLLHCISGWDRTPLFISLLRLSLWADGECHRSLNAMQILYLTIAYDWMLFGHQLHNRLEKGEDVMYFAFDMLQYITNTKFALQTAVDNRQRRKIVEAELHIERSASPMPVTKEQKPAAPPAAAATVSEAPVKRTSALTSALQQQQGLSVPALRKSSSDGSGAMDPRAATLREAGGSAALASSDDEGQSSLLVDGPGSFSPATNLHALPPVSSSYTAAKPTPSLSTFIIEDAHSAGRTPASSAVLSDPLPAASASTTPAASDSSSAAASASPPASASGGLEEDDAHSPYVPSAAPTAAIAIPVRKGSSGTSGAQQQPAAGGEKADSNVSLASATTAAGVASSSGVASGSQMSRVNSWTLLNEKSTPPTAAPFILAAAAHKSTPSKDPAAGSSLQLPSQNGSKTTPVQGASSSSSASASSSAAATAAASAAARAASARRCDRLLEVRSLFMTIWHHSLPSTTPAATSPHAHATSYACAQKAAAARRQPSVTLHDGASLTSGLQNGAAAGEVQPTAVSTNGSKASPPVAAPVTKGTQAPAAASSWFSS